MRAIHKRLTVANDGFCHFKKSAEKRINEKVDKYINKMKIKGWSVDLPIFIGDCFIEKEAIINMYKK